MVLDGLSIFHTIGHHSLKQPCTPPFESHQIVLIAPSATVLAGYDELELTIHTTLHHPPFSNPNHVNATITTVAGGETSPAHLV
jgi:hypothetical protein